MKAEYIDHMGTDLTVVNAARVSFNKESEWVKAGIEEIKGERFDGTPASTTIDKYKLSTKDKGLISYLAKHGHWTPFSHPMITMREKVPIFVARQRFKHMVGFAYNEVSRRYVDDAPEFFMPSEWRARPDKSIKQGSGEPLPFEVQEELNREVRLHHDQCLKFYQYLLDKGVAPELARAELPQSMYTEYYVTGSLAAWARAYKLRIDGHAQKEIQDLAKEWDKIIRPLFPVSWPVLTLGEE